MIRGMVLDLDGPILDGSRRHYACYRHILGIHERKCLSFDDYWTLKRQGLNSRGLLAATGAESLYEPFRRNWLELVERPEYLALDLVQARAVDKLRGWQQRELLLILATLRQDPAAVAHQLSVLKLRSFFRHVVVTGHKEGGRGKAAGVRLVLSDLAPDECVWIGDSEVDCEAARALGTVFWAVASGVRDRDFLLKLGPDFISGDISCVDV